MNGKLPNYVITSVFMTTCAAMALYFANSSLNATENTSTTIPDVTAYLIEPTTTVETTVPLTVVEYPKTRKWKSTWQSTTTSTTPPQTTTTTGAPEPVALVQPVAPTGTPLPTTTTPLPTTTTPRTTTTERDDD